MAAYCCILLDLINITCNTLLVAKRTFYKHTPHYIHTVFCMVLFPASTYTTLYVHMTFFKVLLFSRGRTFQNALCM